MMNFVRFLVQESKHLYTDLRSTLRWGHDLFVKAEELKRPRDPRPLLKGWPEYNSRYTYTGLQLCLLDNKGQIISHPTHCRDYFNEAIRFYVTGGETSNVYAHRIFKDRLDYDNLRFICLSDDSMIFTQPLYKGIENGLRLANMYGRVAGWQDFQTDRGVIPALGEGPERECYIVIGDKNWQRTPQFISLLILLMRICLVHEVPSWITDAYSLQGYWYEKLLVDNDQPYNKFPDFKIFLYNSYDKLLTLVAHEGEIFPHDIDGGYAEDILNFHMTSGLNSLVMENSTHPASAIKLKSLYTEVLKNAGQPN